MRYVGDTQLPCAPMKSAGMSTGRIRSATRPQRVVGHPQQHMRLHVRGGELLLEQHEVLTCASRPCLRSFTRSSKRPDMELS